MTRPVRDVHALEEALAALTVQLDHETREIERLLARIPTDPVEARAHPDASRLLAIAERATRVEVELGAVRRDLRRLSA